MKQFARRICFFAGPGSGKSTLAAKTFAELKIRGYQVEHIPEYIKTWAYSGKKPVSWDQLYVYAKQLHSEDVALRHVSSIVTDSPLLLNNAYAVQYGCKFAELMVACSQKFEEEFPALNFYIARTVPYNSSGRYQTPAEAVAFDEFLLDFLGTRLKGCLHHVRVDQFDEIMKLVENNIQLL